MGELIALPSPRNVASRQFEGGSAEILFFTGVRYYRLSDEDFAKLSSPKPTQRPVRAAKTVAAAAKVAAPARKLKKRA